MSPVTTFLFEERTFNMVKLKFILTIIILLICSVIFGKQEETDDCKKYVDDVLKVYSGNFEY